MSSQRTPGIGQFLVAFGLFWDVICSVYPERRQELDSYLALIGDLNLKYGRIFTTNTIRPFPARSNVRVDWSVLDIQSIYSI